MKFIVLLFKSNRSAVFKSGENTYLMKLSLISEFYFIALQANLNSGDLKLHLYEKNVIQLNQKIMFFEYKIILQYFNALCLFILFLSSLISIKSTTDLHRIMSIFTENLCAYKLHTKEEKVPVVQLRNDKIDTYAANYTLMLIAGKKLMYELRTHVYMVALA